MDRRLGERYELLARLGKGGMATVWRGRDARLLRDVAIKVLDGGAAKDGLFFFHREARAIASLQHPSVVQIFDYSGPDEEQAYIVMELVEGLTLEQLVATRRPLPEPVLAAVAHGLTSAIEHAHGRGVLHRDLKPANVLIGRDGRVLLSDFGIAKAYKDPGRLGETLAGRKTGLFGTPQYMTPEQVEERPIGPESDVFSLGSLLYAMAAGASPFADSDVVEVLRRIVDVEYAPLATARPDAPRELVEMVKACLTRDGRPRASELQRRAGRWLRRLRVLEPQRTLQAFMAGQGTETTLVTSVTGTGAGPPPRSPRRPPLVLAAVGVAGVVVSAGIGVWLGGGAFQGGSTTVELAAPAAVPAPQPAPAPVADPPPAPTARPEDPARPARAADPQPLGASKQVRRDAPPADGARAHPRPPGRPPEPVKGETPPPAPPRAEAKGEATGQATLEITVLPWGTVFLDGQEKGNTPVLRLLTVSAGKRRLKISHPTLGTVEQEVVLQGGQRKTVVVDLRKKP